MVPKCVVDCYFYCSYNCSLVCCRFFGSDMTERDFFKPAKEFSGWSLFFCGICMGAADLVPGISGGTIAFILGFYQPLIASLKTINKTAFLYLFTGRWRIFPIMWPGSLSSLFWLGQPLLFSVLPNSFILF